MFVTASDLSANISHIVKIIGTVSNIDPPIVELSTDTGKVIINYKKLHMYTKGILCVTGKVIDSNTIEEIYVDELSDNVDMKLVSGFVKVNKQYPELFMTNN
ncbi:Replication factor A protein 3 [Spraguea lophii 42_110]|uniref:Replication factor A protein 3 n=1 Tax=Spraguea lophii (strain 42_110) TaxID=1358809 RepID=S7W6K3_SPRLO|nr:Replication factor A protein 3 [Spraguea lophii 42_110]